MRGVLRFPSAAKSALVAVQRHGSRGEIAELTLNRFSSAAKSALVVVQRHGSRGEIAELRLNAPESLNALTDDMGDAFSAAVARLKTEPPGSLDAVLLSGAGRAFSAGGDVGFLQQRAAAAPADNVATMRDFYRKFLCVRSLPVPTVACLHGPAVGAGLCVALACDARVVAADARRPAARCAESDGASSTPSHTDVTPRSRRSAARRADAAADATDSGDAGATQQRRIAATTSMELEQPTPAVGMEHAGARATEGMQADRSRLRADSRPLIGELDQSPRGSSKAFQIQRRDRYTRHTFDEHPAGQFSSRRLREGYRRVQGGRARAAAAAEAGRSASAGRGRGGGGGG